MKRAIVFIFTVIGISLPALACATTWSVDPDHSNVGFHVRHLMISNIRGTIEKLSGIIDINDKDISKSTVDVFIDATSTKTNLKKRDEHLRSADFFNVAKYPIIRFKSKKVVKTGGTKLAVTGDLTLHGVTREVILNVDGPSGEIKDPSRGDIRRGASAYTKINRKDFGLIWNKTLETGGVAVGEEVFITLEIEMVKAAIKK